MKHIEITKQTINWEKKIQYKQKRNQQNVVKQQNLKRSYRYGYTKNDNLKKYGIMQCLENYELVA